VVGHDKAQWEVLCGRDVERYRKQARDYLECLDLERIAAERRANAVVERYNCRRRGGTYCP
jgi:hypothetical protein